MGDEWEDSLAGLLPDDDSNNPADSADGQPGLTVGGQPSPLIRSRGADVRWVLTSRTAKWVTALLVAAMLVSGIMLYALPAAQGWWAEKTGRPSPDPTVIYITPTPTGSPEPDPTPVM